MIVLVFLPWHSSKSHAINIKFTIKRIVKDKFKIHFPPKKGKWINDFKKNRNHSVDF